MGMVMEMAVMVSPQYFESGGENLQVGDNNYLDYQYPQKEMKIPRLYLLENEERSLRNASPINSGQKSVQWTNDSRIDNKGEKIIMKYYK